MKLFNSQKKSKRVHIPEINPISTLEVYAFQGSTLSIQIEILRHPFSGGPFPSRESRLRVTISNVGEREVEDLSVEANAPEGTLIVDPGMLFGTTRRHVRLPRLLAGKSITYKLGIRAKPNFESGFLMIHIKEAIMNSAGSNCDLKVGLTAS